MRKHGQGTKSYHAGDVDVSTTVPFKFFAFFHTLHPKHAQLPHPTESRGLPVAAIPSPPGNPSLVAPPAAIHDPGEYERKPCNGLALNLFLPSALHTLVNSS